jgi:hypothetical protein
MLDSPADYGANTVRVLRGLGLGLAIVVFAVLALRAAVIAVMIPYGIWTGLREGGYPMWARMLGVATVIGAVVYLIRRSILRGKRREYDWRGRHCLENRRVAPSGAGTPTRARCAADLPDGETTCGVFGSRRLHA